MKKNTILIVIDSIYYDKTISQDYRKCPMPFLAKLRSEGIDFTNMYSEAPYTEAAFVSLLCGMDTLKKGGYLKKMYGKETIMQTFQKNGYTTFSNCVQPVVYPSYSFQGLDYEYYNICYEFDQFWTYRLNYYSDLYNKNELDVKTLNVVVDLLDDNIYTWKKFLYALKNKEEVVSFIMEFMKIENLDENIKLLDNEIKNYEKNKINYTKRLLELGKEHELFNIYSYSVNRKQAPEVSKKVYDRYHKIVKKIIRKNSILNLKNNRLVIGPKDERKGLLKAYINSIYNSFTKNTINPNTTSKKNAPSMDTTLKHFENWVLNRKDDKPYFAYLHFDDVHSHEIFYTYDTDDFKQLDEEFGLIDEFLKNVPKNYKGNLAYDIALQYADLCLKRLFQFLEENNMLDDVTVGICADHGSSYTFDPYRYRYVNTIHRENFNMPFVLWSRGLKHKVVDGFYNNKEIPATLLDINGIKIPNDYDGISTLNSKPRDYVLIENFMGGCPDYNLRDFWIGIRNKNYLVVMVANKDMEFKDLELYAVYDLKKDKKELYNLKDTIDRKDIKKELDIIEEEFNLLKEDIKKYNYLDYKIGGKNAKS